jgi:hypothetical protein
MGLLLVVAVLMVFKRGADARPLDGDSADRGKKIKPGQVSRDNLDDEPATIRMTLRRRRGDEGRA